MITAVFRIQASQLSAIDRGYHRTWFPGLKILTH
jgi:hypothetical protein